MEKRFLFIAEKPSLMRDVQSCYKKHKQEIVSKVGEIDFIALAGHICHNCEPDTYDEWEGQKWQNVHYPMIPNYWQVEPINEPYKKKILNEIKGSVKNYDGIIVGTDSDVEGYGIYYLLEEYLGIKDKFALRFIEHSLTDSEILKSLLSMTDYHKDPTHVKFTESYILRSRADWLYGMNGTRMMSVKQGQVMTVGRVKAPTIKLVYDNSMSIENFTSQKYYQVESDYGNFSATLMDENGQLASFTDKLKIPTFPLQGKVIDKQTTRSYEHAPKLFDLTAIQAEAGQKFGYSPTETLNIIQSLYETHKVISYPRTQCRYVSLEKSKEFKNMISLMDAFPDLKLLADKITDEDIARVRKDKQVVNDIEVQKESHDALLPTSNKPDINKLNLKEKNICQMIYARLLAQFLPQGADDKTQLIIQHGDGTFIAKGKIVVEPGWRVLYRESKDKTLPNYEKGDDITAKKIAAVEKVTTPPKRLTQATLLNAMRNIANLIEDKELKKSLSASQGIGTPATRANIIKDIMDRAYVEEKKGGLYITNLGKQYINSLKELDIVSPIFAAIMDTDIKKIQRGEAEYNSVYKKILEDLNNMCAQINNMQGVNSNVEINETCPKCHAKLTAGRFSYECPNEDFKVSKNICGQEISEELLHSLLQGEKSPNLKFKKKDGTEFEAKLVVSAGELKFDFTPSSSNCECPSCHSKLNVGRFNYECPNCDFKASRSVCGKDIDETLLNSLLEGKTSPQYTFKKKDGKTFKARLVMLNNALSFDFSSGLKCPSCQEKELTLNRGGAFCDCGLKVFRKTFGHELTDKELTKLLTKGRIDGINDFVSKAGKTFSGNLVLTDGKVELEFPQK